MSFRKYELDDYQAMCERHTWDVPERYNIAHDVCDKHERDRLAMVWEDWEGEERRVDFGELQDMSNRFANYIRVSYSQPWSPAVEDAIGTVGQIASAMS